jgi:hypothetical protein
VSDLYDEIGVGYSAARRTDPRWMTAIVAALGDSRTVLDVGAGTGSYEPVDRQVYAVEPAAGMIRQRNNDALAVLTVHHWTNWRRGIAELRRVAQRQVVLAYDTRLHADYWFVREYVPEIASRELSRPSAEDIATELGACTVTPLLVPWDFTDGVFPAYWRRPAAYLSPEARHTCSALAQAPSEAVSRGLARLRDDLASGRWRERHQDLLDLAEWDAGFRLIVSG